MIAKTYGRMELAQLYFPYITQKSATRKLGQWIATNPTLSAAILPNTRTLTPRQVRLIFDEVGEPGE